MKLIGRLSVLLAAALFLLSVLMFSQAVGGRNSRGVSDPEQAEAGAQGAYRYILKSDNGRVMLYRSGSGTEPEELDIPYYDLPPEDRALLDSGITISDESQLLSVIEDYTS